MKGLSLDTHKKVDPFPGHTMCRLVIRAFILLPLIEILPQPTFQSLGKAPAFRFLDNSKLRDNIPTSKLEDIVISLKKFKV